MPKKQRQLAACSSPAAGSAWTVQRVKTDGEPSTRELERWMAEGWEVVAIVPSWQHPRYSTFLRRPNKELSDAEPAAGGTNAV